MNALRAFESTARRLSVTQAAMELHVTPGAVSHQLRALEAFLGVELFVRGHRQMSLTEPGERYFRAVSGSFEAIRSATVALRHPGAKDRLRVRTYTTFALRWLIPRLPLFYADRRSVELMLSTSNDPVDFNREPLDFAIRLGEGPWPGVTAERLFPNVLAPVCSPSLLARGPALDTAADLAHHVLLDSMSPERRDDWGAWLQAEGVTSPVGSDAIYFESSALCYQAAVEGQGLAMAQIELVRDDIAAGRLVLPFSRELDRGAYTYHLIYPEGRALTPLMKGFRDWMVAQSRCSGGALAPRRPTGLPLADIRA